MADMPNFVNSSLHNKHDFVGGVERDVVIRELEPIRSNIIALTDIFLDSFSILASSPRRISITQKGLCFSEFKLVETLPSTFRSVATSVEILTQVRSLVRSSNHFRIFGLSLDLSPDLSAIAAHKPLVQTSKPLGNEHCSFK